jgi:hyperosmotically inducible protein
VRQLVPALVLLAAVDNHIQLLPLSPDDGRIRFAAYRAIDTHPAQTPYALQAEPPVHIIVRNRNATLRRAVAAVEANSIPGVHSITNDLAVDRTIERPL